MQIKKPAGASLLGRLWDYMETPQAPEASELDEDAVLPDGPAGQRFLLRMTSASLPAQASQAALARQGTAWQWRAEAGDESIIGTVAHAWLERIDKERSEEHTSELQSLMRISYAVFCLKNKNKKQIYKNINE